MSSENELPFEMVDWLGSLGRGRLSAAVPTPGGRRREA